MSAVTNQADEGLIFDIGMDQCQDTEFYLKKGFRVVAVDASPEACAKAESRFAAEVASGRLTIVNRAISPSKEPLRFFLCEDFPGQSTAEPHLRDRLVAQGYRFREITVAACSMADLLAEYGVPRYVKVDIEGYDLVCLEGLKGAAAQPQFISTEVEFRELRRHLRLLSELGYRRFAVINQRDVPKQVPPAEAREGRFVDHRFEVYSSGLFGLELPAPWMNERDTKRHCWSLWRQAKVYGLLRKLKVVKPLAPALDRIRARMPIAGQWFDIHATV
jgi:FkbM family methyltransferase